MGTPITPPYPEYGDDCGYCTPALWSAGETPKFIYAYFQGISDCSISSHDVPNGQTFKLEQDSVLPCYWVHEGPIYHVYYQPLVPAQGKSLLQLQDHVGFSFLFNYGPMCPPEFTVYENWMQFCELQYAGSGGTGTIFWSDEILQLVNAFGLMPGPDLFHELFNAPNADIIHKFCDRYQRTNVKFMTYH